MWNIYLKLNGSLKTRHERLLNAKRLIKLIEESWDLGLTAGTSGYQER